MKTKTITLQRTFIDYEHNAIAWIDSLHQAFSIRKLVMKRKNIPYSYKWTVVITVENK